MKFLGIVNKSSRLSKIITKPSNASLRQSLQTFIWFWDGATSFYTCLLALAILPSWPRSQCPSHPHFSTQKSKFIWFWDGATSFYACILALTILPPWPQESMAFSPTFLNGKKKNTGGEHVVSILAMVS